MNLVNAARAEDLEAGSNDNIARDTDLAANNQEDSADPGQSLALRGTSEPVPKATPLKFTNNEKKRHPIIIDGEFMVISEPKRFSSRLFNTVASVKLPPKEILAKRAFDILSGAAVSGAARYAFIGAGTLVGATGLPLVLGSAIAAGVARTVWTIHKEKNAYNKVHAYDEQLSFWQFAGLNRKKYITSLATSTMFAGAGATFMTYVLPHIEPVVAPLFNKLAHIPVVSSALGFIAGKWNELVGGHAPAPPSVTVPIDRSLDALHQPHAAPVAPVEKPVPVAPQTHAPVHHHRPHVRHHAHAVAKDIVKAPAPHVETTPAPVAAAPVETAPAATAEMVQAPDMPEVYTAPPVIPVEVHELPDITPSVDTAPAPDMPEVMTAPPVMPVEVHELPDITPSVHDTAPAADLGPKLSDAELADVSQAAPAPVAPAAITELPKDASLNIQWRMNALGQVEGFIKQAPTWLKDGMQIKAPTVEVQ